MDSNLHQEDLLIKLRSKLNGEKLKLWEPPYLTNDGNISENLKDLAKRYSTELSVDEDTVLQALHQLQLHSLDRSKANAEFKETGLATFNVKATLPGEKPRVLKVQKRLDAAGSELIASVAEVLSVVETRVKLIVNGKVIKPTPSLEEQGVKNGAQVMALIMAETPAEVQKKDSQYLQMKSTRDDAALLADCEGGLADADEYVKLEDQSGKAVELPPAERRSLVVGVALHERGRTAASQKDYSLALVLFLEADRQFSECRSSILQSVDNYGVLQLDICWCYLCLQYLNCSSDAAARLRNAEQAFKKSYGDNLSRLIALKGTNANERVLLMRLYLLQGIVAYHHNSREEARRLLEQAEREMDSLRVDESSVLTLVELGWSIGSARTGLRASGGDLARAHNYLTEKRKEREEAREMHRQQRQAKLLGVCQDGSVVSQQLVEALVGMGFTNKMAAAALKNSNNHVAEAVRLIQEEPLLLYQSSEESSSSDESPAAADNKLLAELKAMGYDDERAQTALRIAHNHIAAAVELLTGEGGILQGEAANPSTSAGTAFKMKIRKHKKSKSRKQREQALSRLTDSLQGEEDDYLDSALVEEEEFLVQYKSLL